MIVWQEPYYPLPENIHNYPYYLVIGYAGIYYLFYSDKPFEMSDDGSMVQTHNYAELEPSDYTIYRTYSGVWSLLVDGTGGTHSLMGTVIEANYAIGDYTPPAKWD